MDFVKTICRSILKLEYHSSFGNMSVYMFLAFYLRTLLTYGELGCKTTNLGLEYMGTENMTRSCIPCQRWDSDFPHDHINTESMKEHENYCRNPDREPEGPWCYTMDPGKRYEYCDVQFCGLTPAVSSLIKCQITTTHYTTAAYVNGTFDSAVSPTQLPEVKNVSESQCICRCYTNEQFIAHSTKSSNHNYTNAELKQQIKEELREISEQLKVQKNLTSAWVRARRCADDQRMTCVGMGYVAIGIIALPFILTLISDCCKLK